VRYIPGPSVWGCDSLQHAWSAAFATRRDLLRAALGGATPNLGFPTCTDLAARRGVEWDGSLRLSARSGHS